MRCRHSLVAAVVRGPSTRRCWPTRTEEYLCVTLRSCNGEMAAALKSWPAGVHQDRVCFDQPLSFFICIIFSSKA